MGSLWACGVGLETHGMDYFSRPGVWGRGWEGPGGIALSGAGAVRWLPASVHKNFRLRKSAGVRLWDHQDRLWANCGLR